MRSRLALVVLALVLSAARVDAACTLYYRPANFPATIPNEYRVCATLADRPASGTTEGDEVWIVDIGTKYIWHNSAWAIVDGGASVSLNTDSPAGDAFGRIRVSSPASLFVSSSEYNASALLWEDALTASGTSTHVAASSTVRLRVTASGDKVVRQTRQYFRYQPGKSQIIAITFQSVSSDDADVRRRVGYFDANEGIFYEQVGTTLKICKRKGASDTCVGQSSWNVDTLNGSGASAITFSPTNSQILLIDLQWLGVGRVRVGFDIGGVFVIAHEFLNANNTTSTYMRTATLPVRYEIEATGTVTTNHDLSAICAAVQSEGGFDPDVGYPRGVGSATSIAVTTRRNVLSIRPKATFNSIVNRATLIVEGVEQTAATNSAFCELIYNTTLGGSPSWTSAGTNSVVEYDVAGTTITGGDVLMGWFIVAGAGTVRGLGAKDFSSRLPLTLDQAGASPISMTIACTSLTGTSNVTTALSWREIW